MDTEVGCRGCATQYPPSGLSSISSPLPNEGTLFFEITSILGLSKDLAGLPSTQNVKEGVEKASSAINII
jgi:hypothetical protein